MKHQKYSRIRSHLTILAIDNRRYLCKSEHRLIRVSSRRRPWQKRKKKRKRSSGFEAKPQWRIGAEDITWLLYLSVRFLRYSSVSWRPGFWMDMKIIIATGVPRAAIIYRHPIDKVVAVEFLWNLGIFPPHKKEHRNSPKTYLCVLLYLFIKVKVTHGRISLIDWAIRIIILQISNFSVRKKYFFRYLLNNNSFSRRRKEFKEFKLDHY